MAARVGAAGKASGPGRVGAAVVGLGPALGVEAGNWPEEVAGAVEDEGSRGLVGDVIRVHMATGAEPGVPLGRVRREDARGIVGEPCRTVTGGTQQDRALGRVRPCPVRTPAGRLGAPNMAAHAQVLLRVGRRNGEAQLAFIRRSMRIVADHACGRHRLRLVALGVRRIGVPCYQRLAAVVAARASGLRRWLLDDLRVGRLGPFLREGLVHA